jgi:hypothetical protein
MKEPRGKEVANRSNPESCAGQPRSTERSRTTRLTPPPRSRDYRWSSYRGYVDKQHAEEFVTYDVLKEFFADLLLA